MWVSRSLKLRGWVGGGSQTWLTCLGSSYFLLPGEEGLSTCAEDTGKMSAIVVSAPQSRQEWAAGLAVVPNASVLRNLLKVQEEDFNGKEALSISPAPQVCVTQGPAHAQTPSVPDRKESALHGNHSSSLEDRCSAGAYSSQTRTCAVHSQPHQQVSSKEQAETWGQWPLIWKSPWKFSSSRSVLKGEK